MTSLSHLYLASPEIRSYCVGPSSNRAESHPTDGPNVCPWSLHQKLEFCRLRKFACVLQCNFTWFFLKLCVLYQIVHQLLTFICTPVVNHILPDYNLRSYNPYLLHKPLTNTNTYNHSFFPDSITHWNNLPVSILS